MPAADTVIVAPFDQFQQPTNSSTTTGALAVIGAFFTGVGAAGAGAATTVSVDRGAISGGSVFGFQGDQGTRV